MVTWAQETRIWSGLAATDLVRKLGRQVPGRIGLRIMAMPPVGLTTLLAPTFKMRIEVTAPYRFIWPGRNNQYRSSTVAAGALPRSYVWYGLLLSLFHNGYVIWHAYITPP